MSTQNFSRNPVNPDQIKTLYSTNGIRLNQTNCFKRVDEILKGIKIPGEFANKPNEKEIMDLYCDYRSWIVFSEGMNKIWPTVELHLKELDGQMKVEGFHIWYSNSTTIPALHYANIYFLISFITAFGVVPLRIKKEDVFLIRQDSFFYSIEKEEYIKRRSLGNPDGWHEVMLKVAEDVAKESKITLPFQEIGCIRKARNFLDYQILAKEDLSAQTGELYFGKSLKLSMNLAYKIYKVFTEDLGLSPRNGADKRLNNLVSVAEKIIKGYESKTQIIALEKVVTCLKKLP